MVAWGPMLFAALAGPIRLTDEMGGGCASLRSGYAIWSNLVGQIGADET